MRKETTMTTDAWTEAHRFPFNTDENWSETEEGLLTIHDMNPGLIAPGIAARVIYELRLDVARLNSEAIEVTAKYRRELALRLAAETELALIKTALRDLTA
jgi:hypothetical protein